MILAGRGKGCYFAFHSIFFLKNPHDQMAREASIVNRLLSGDSALGMSYFSGSYKALFMWHDYTGKRGFWQLRLVIARSLSDEAICLD